MKKLIIGTAFILSLATFGSAAYANVDKFAQDSCQSTLPAVLTGGAIGQRNRSVTLCEREVQQVTINAQETKSSDRRACEFISPARTSGGTIRQRQRCSTEAR
ncbi:hypothetical protein IQ238_01245 [Pleurocapsales cyanobacterium LEGE 06147]|nr:hypothetical protein [Pleurocapsales cyanobacterium LEGE 06147]